jgi:hypothetical protein
MLKMDNTGDGYYSASASQTSFKEINSMDDNNYILEELQVDQERTQRDSDVDSAYDTESLVGEDTYTLASFITDYRYEHGRRYHAYKDGSYWVGLAHASKYSCLSAAADTSF